MLRRGDLRVELFAAENSKPQDANRREPNTAFHSQGSLHFAFAVPDARAMAETCASAARISCGYRISRGAPMRLSATTQAISLSSCSRKIWRKRREEDRRCS